MLLPFAPPYIHKLLLELSINNQYYKELTPKEGHRNRGKPHEEIIGRRRVTYTYSPNGTVEVAVTSNYTPFRLETDDDLVEIFSFFGQVRDRLLYHVSDIHERQVPPIIQWVLKQCDLNKDIEISDKAQLTFPDIQLKLADRVFRLYIKALKDKAVCRAEESLVLNQMLPEALDAIRHPYRSIENKIENKMNALSEQVKQLMDSRNHNCNHGAYKLPVPPTGSSMFILTLF